VKISGSLSVREWFQYALFSIRRAGPPVPKKRNGADNLNHGPVLSTLRSATEDGRSTAEGREDGSSPTYGSILVEPTNGTTAERGGTQMSRVQKLN